MGNDTDYRRAKVVKRSQQKTVVLKADNTIMFEVKHVADKILMVGADFTKEDCIITTYIHLN